MLVETKVLEGERGVYRLAKLIDSIQVPATVQAVLAARFDRLSPEEKRLLQAKLRPDQEKALRDYLDSKPQLDDGAILNAIRLVMSTPEYQLT